MTPAETTIVLVVAIAVIALVIRGLSRDERAARPPEAMDQVETLLADVSRADPATISEVVAITSDGWAFVPDGEEVQLIPPDTHDEDLPRRSDVADGARPQTDPVIQVLSGRGGPVDPRTRRPVAQWKPGARLDVGDLIGARVKRGAPDLDPWRLEALGRDGDYRAWFFETEESSRAALDLLVRRVVRAPKDEDGEPRPPRPEDYEEARRLDEETERALDDSTE
jgi:hypothetical protein